MFVFPELDTPELQAFFCGFALPFIAASMGWLVSIVRKMLKNIDRGNG